MTGIVIEATLQMLPIQTAVMIVDTERARDLDDCMDRWPDAQLRIPVFGGLDRLPGAERAIGPCLFTRADHVGLEDLPTTCRSMRRCASLPTYVPRFR